VGALKYLAVLPKIVRYDILHPQRATVLRELAKALDDPKRSVRKEAVEARSVRSVRFFAPIHSDHLIARRQDKLVHVFWLKRRCSLHWKPGENVLLTTVCAIL
jgi:hypothetical protein